MTRRTAVFRCDASVEIGGGHVVRCMALASAFQVAGWACLFATTKQTLDLFPALPGYFPGSVTFEPDDIDAIGGLAGNADLMVFDGYGYDAEYEKRFAGLSELTMALDDAPVHFHGTDIVLDQTLGRLAEEYDPFTSSSAHKLCGSEFALLRPEFARLRAAGLRPIADGDRLRVLVSFGLTDAADGTGRCLSAMRDMPVDVDVVIGSSAPHRQKLASLIQEAGPTWRLHNELGAEEMAQAMFKADVVLGAPGSASYERCCLGRPSLLLVAAENQLANAKALAGCGAALVLGDISRSLDTAALRSKITDALEDTATLRLMGKRAALVSDGKGAERAVNRITAILEKSHDA